MSEASADKQGTGKPGGEPQAPPDRGAGPGADSGADPGKGADDELDGRQVAGAVMEGVRDVFAPAARLIELIGDHLILMVRALSWLPRRPYRFSNYLEAGEYIGFGSLPIIILVGVFTGMVTALQMVDAFRVFGLESIAGGVTGKSIAIELGPVLTCLMLQGRAGAGIATELGTMRITEQIDALESMAVNPVQFLILPRLVMGVVMAPILTLLFFVVGMGGAYFVAVFTLNVDAGQFVENFEALVKVMDVVQGVVKSMVFGLVVILISCYQGFNAKGGGRGVGLGTTRAVVAGSVAVLVLDYFVTDILLAILPKS